tara:strand:- start:257 stop:484 length:228 start_codon:yes stop_codon:yes gene_type:complete
MIKNRHHIISELEMFIESFDHEYQSVGNEIKVYLGDSEVYITINECIDIYEPSSTKPYSFSNLNDAINKLNSIFS